MERKVQNLLFVFALFICVVTAQNYVPSVCSNFLVDDMAGWNLVSSITDSCGGITTVVPNNWGPFLLSDDRTFYGTTMNQNSISSGMRTPVFVVDVTGPVIWHTKAMSTAFTNLGTSACCGSELEIFEYRTGGSGPWTILDCPDLINAHPGILVDLEFNTPSLNRGTLVEFRVRILGNPTTNSGGTFYVGDHCFYNVFTNDPNACSADRRLERKYQSVVAPP